MEEWGEIPTVTESTLLSRYIDMFNEKNLRIADFFTNSTIVNMLNEFK